MIDRPIAISIETKTDGENKTDALNQLTTWAFAHMTRLHQLLDCAKRLSGARDDTEDVAEARLPPLPMLLAQGPVWTLFMATENAKTGNKVRRWVDDGHNSY